MSTAARAEMLALGDDCTWRDTLTARDAAREADELHCVGAVAGGTMAVGRNEGLSQKLLYRCLKSKDTIILLFPPFPAN